MFYLYKITSPSLWFYVGVTKNPELRFSQHARSQHPVGHAIRKYGKEHMKYDLIAHGTSEEMYALEAYIVTEEFLKTQNTYNQKVGGIISPAFTGRTHTQDSKMKIAESLRGRVFSEEHRKKIGQKNKLRPYKQMSEERKLQVKECFARWRENADPDVLLEMSKRNPHSELTKQKISQAHCKGALHHNAKPIEQYDLNNTFIAEYGSTRLAADATGLTQSVIQKCLKGLVQKPKFIFKYKLTDGM